MVNLSLEGGDNNPAPAAENRGDADTVRRSGWSPWKRSQESTSRPRTLNPEPFRCPPAPIRPRRIDKITNPQIKSARMTDAAKLDNVLMELALLDGDLARLDFSAVDIMRNGAGCATSTAAWWDIEDGSAQGAGGPVDAGSIELARAGARDERRACGDQLSHQRELGSSWWKKSYRETGSRGRGGREEGEGGRGEKTIHDDMGHVPARVDRNHDRPFASGNSTVLLCGDDGGHPLSPKLCPVSRRTVPAMVSATPIRSHTHARSSAWKFTSISRHGPACREATRKADGAVATARTP